VTAWSFATVRQAEQAPEPTPYGSDRGDGSDLCDSLPAQLVAESGDHTSVIIGEVPNGMWVELLEEVALAEREGKYELAEHQMLGCRLVECEGVADIGGRGCTWGGIAKKRLA
jgi:hypothetical protein